MHTFYLAFSLPCTHRQTTDERATTDQGGTDPVLGKLIFQFFQTFLGPPPNWYPGTNLNKVILKKMGTHPQIWYGVKIGITVG